MQKFFINKGVLKKNKENQIIKINMNIKIIKKWIRRNEYMLW